MWQVSCPYKMPWQYATWLVCQWPVSTILTTPPHRWRSASNGEPNVCLDFKFWRQHKKKRKGKKRFQPSHSTASSSSGLNLSVSKCVLKGTEEAASLRSPWANARRLSIILHARIDARNCWNLCFKKNYSSSDSERRYSVMEEGHLHG